MAGVTNFLILLLLLSSSYFSLACDDDYCGPPCPSPSHPIYPPKQPPRTNPPHHPPNPPGTPCPSCPSPTPGPPTSPYAPPTPTPTPRPPYSPPTPTPRPPTPGPQGQAYCPIDAIKLNACVDVLSGLIHIVIGQKAKAKCCPLIRGIADLDAALCFCTIIRARLLSLNIYLPIALELLITCGKHPPPGFQCPPLQ